VLNQILGDQSHHHVLPGDYNGDNLVETADYLCGAKGLAASSRRRDYLVWTQTFRRQIPLLAPGAVEGGAIPEPTSARSAALRDAACFSFADVSASSDKLQYAVSSNQTPGGAGGLTNWFVGRHAHGDIKQEPSMNSKSTIFVIATLIVGQQRFSPSALRNRCRPAANQNARL